MTTEEKLAVINTWTHKFLIESHDHSPDGKYLGRITVYPEARIIDYTDYRDTKAEVINEAYDLVKDNLWFIVNSL
jgi:hypothetical protein